MAFLGCAVFWFITYLRLAGWPVSAARERRRPWLARSTDQLRRMRVMMVLGLSSKRSAQSTTGILRPRHASTWLDRLFLCCSAFVAQRQLLGSCSVHLRRSDSVPASARTLAPYRSRNLRTPAIGRRREFLGPRSCGLLRCLAGASARAWLASGCRAVCASGRDFSASMHDGCRIRRIDHAASQLVAAHGRCGTAIADAAPHDRAELVLAVGL